MYNKLTESNAGKSRFLSDGEVGMYAEQNRITNS